MSDVISFKTRKNLNKQDTKVNDKIASEGTYIGCLPEADSEHMRMWQDRLIVQQRQIDELIDSFAEDHSQYLANVVRILLHFNIDPSTFNPDTDKLMIGKDGHVWIGKIEEDKNND